MTEKEFWKEKLLEDQSDFIKAMNIYHKTLERFMYSTEGKATPNMSKIYQNWKSMQPKKN